MTLKEALISLKDSPVLINDGADDWTLANLLDALIESGDEAYLTRRVYACEEYIATLDDEGMQVTPPLYRIVRLSETPYFVEHESGGYRIKLMLSEEQQRSRYIYGNSLRAKKQPAYRRKSKLNEEWQKFRVLGA